MFLNNSLPQPNSSTVCLPRSLEALWTVKVKRMEKQQPAARVQFQCKLLSLYQGQSPSFFQYHLFAFIYIRLITSYEAGTEKDIPIVADN